MVRADLEVDTMRTVTTFDSLAIARQLTDAGIERHVGVEERHGPRVMRRNSSHDNVMRKGVSDMAFEHASRLFPGAAAGRFSRTSTYRSSPSRSGVGPPAACRR